MPQKKYLVTLEDTEREQLEQLLHSGVHATRKVMRARILLKAAEGWEDQAITAALAVGRATVERLRQRFVEEGLGALEERPRPGTRPKRDEKAEARLIAEACSSAPEGRKRWTLHLLVPHHSEFDGRSLYRVQSGQPMHRRVPSDAPAKVPCDP
jgi:transposase